VEKKLDKVYLIFLNNKILFHVRGLTHYRRLTHCFLAWKFQISDSEMQRCYLVHGEVRLAEKFLAGWCVTDDRHVLIAQSLSLYRILDVRRLCIKSFSPTINLSVAMPIQYEGTEEEALIFTER
jgi:hypothetical protein